MSGLEVLAAAASAISITDLAGRLSVKLFAFAKSVKGAQKQIETVSREVAATGAVMLQFGKELEGQEKRQVVNPEAVSVAKSLVSECDAVFKELGDVVDEDVDTKEGLNAFLKSVMKRVKWTFQEGFMDLLRTNLERLKSSLALILHVMVLAAQMKSHAQLETVMKQKEVVGLLLKEKEKSETLWENSIANAANRYPEEKVPEEVTVEKEESDDIVEVVEEHGPEESSRRPVPQNDDHVDDRTRPPFLKAENARINDAGPIRIPRTPPIGKKDRIEVRNDGPVPLVFKLPTLRPSALLNDKTGIHFASSGYSQHKRRRRIFSELEDQLTEYTKVTQRLISHVSDMENGLPGWMKGALEHALLEAHWNSCKDLRHMCGFELVYDTVSEVGGKALVSVVPVSPVKYVGNFF